MRREPDRTQAVAMLAVVVAAALVAYLPSLGNGFAFDDQAVILDAAPFLGDASQLGRVLSRDYFALSGEATYRPLVTLSYALDWHVGGGKPFPFHLQNVLWHALASALALLLFVRLRVAPRVAGFAAASFAVHPALTEAVGAVSFREDVMAAALGTGALLAWTMRKRSGARVRNAVLGGVLLLLALLSKESALAFVVLAPVAWWKRGSGLRDRRPEAAALVVAVAVFALLRFVLFASPPSYAEFVGGSRWAALGSGFAALLHYLRLTFWPLGLCVDYRGVMEPVTSTEDLRAWLGVGAFVVLVATAVRLRRTRPVVAFGIAWFVAGLLPVMNLVPIPVFVAERFLYLPLMGAALAIVCTLEEPLTPRLARRGSVVVLALFLALTLQRHDAWKDDLTLWKTTHEDFPHAYGAMHGYATALQERGRPGEAIPLHLRALEHEPLPDYERAAILRSLGTAYGMMGAADQSAAALTASLTLERNARAHYHLAIAYLQMGRHTQAEAETRRALALDPDFAEPHRTLADLVRMRGNDAEAERLMRRYEELAGG